MLIDNSNLIKPFLSYNGDDEPYFYSAEIIKRRKDNPEMTSGTRVIDSFYIYSGEFDELYPKMKVKAEQNNARVYIQLNKKSARMVSLRALRKMAENIERGDYIACRRSYQSAAGETCSAGSDKVWLVDLDKVHLEYQKEIENIIMDCYAPKYIPLENGSKIEEPRNSVIEEKIPTVNGLHLITKPFNRQMFDKKWNELYVKLNMPVNVTKPDVGKVGQGTLLYYSNEKNGGSQ